MVCVNRPFQLPSCGHGSPHTLCSTITRELPASTGELETAWRASPTTSRRCVFGGAARPSALERRRSGAKFSLRQGVSAVGRHITMSLGAVKVLSLVVFDSGMNILEAWRLAAPPSIHESTAQHVAHMSFVQSLLAGPENCRYA
jgi:hypothetical protein